MPALVSTVPRFIRSCLLAGAPLLSATGAGAADLEPFERVELRREQATIQLREREWLLLSPRTPQPEPAPLLVLLHFLNGLPVEMANLTAVARLVRDHGAWVVLPQALGGRWKNGPVITAGKTGDDLVFLDQLIERLLTEHPLDPDRVYMAGYSNGALMAEYYACNRPDRLAAMGFVASTSDLTTLPVCAPAAGVPLLMIHGTEDPVVPYEGSAIRRSAPATAAFWAQALGCAATPVMLPFAEGQDPRTTLDYRRHEHCARGSVDLLTVIGGGHTYPGTLDFSPSLGVVSQDLDATDLLWGYFAPLSRAASGVSP